MIINYLLWLLTGLAVGYISYEYDRIKNDSLQLHLVFGALFCYAIAFFVNTVIWSANGDEINYVALIIGGGLTFFALESIDYFYHTN